MPGGSAGLVELHLPEVVMSSNGRGWRPIGHNPTPNAIFNHPEKIGYIVDTVQSQGRAKSF